MLLPSAIQRLPRDAWLIFATRSIRRFAYGALSVILVFYFVGLGFNESQTGLLLTLTLVGGACALTAGRDVETYAHPRCHLQRKDWKTIVLCGAGRDFPRRTAADQATRLFRRGAIIRR